MMGKHTSLLVITSLLTLTSVLLAGCIPRTSDTATPAPAAAQRKVRIIELQAVSGSTETAQATLTEVTESTLEVQIHSETMPENVVRGAAFFEGSCHEPSKQLMLLNDVVNGDSITVLELDVQETFAVTPEMVIAMTATEDPSENFVACGAVEW